MEWTLQGIAPFSFDAVVASHGWRRLAPFAWDEEGRELAYVGRLGSGRVVEMRLREAAGGVRVQVDSALGDGERADISAQVHWMMGLDQDLSAFYALARGEPKLAHVEERAQGRLLRSPTLFEDTVKTILTTNTTWAGTVRMVDALVGGFGEPLPAGSGRRAFPTPERLARVDPGSLRVEAKLGYRAPYVVELAQAIAQGRVDLEALKTTDLPAADLQKRLLALKGVGSYAAASLLMLLGRYAYVPVDSWARKLVSHEWYGGEPVGQSEVEAAFEGWGAWKGLAYWFWDWSYLQGG
jgi:3-methyladenine DNA glycosylase/8-oxoguanine DNA glycosylase